MRDFSVQLRRFRPDEAAALFAAVQESQEQVGQWLPDLAALDRPDRIAAWLATHDEVAALGTSYPFAIVDSLTDTLVGGCGLTRMSLRHRFANAHYWVRTDATGRGIAGAALRLLARYGLVVQDLERIEALAAVGNRPSQRAAEKAGAQREGVLRRRIVHPDAVHDAVLYSFIRTDLETPTFGAPIPGARPREAAYALLTDTRGRLALVRGRRGNLWLPGGGAESGETAEEALRREVREEMGAAIRIVGRLPDARQFFVADDGVAYDHLSAFFLVRLLDTPAGGEEEIVWQAPPLPPADMFAHASHAHVAASVLPCARSEVA